MTWLAGVNLRLLLRAIQVTAAMIMTDFNLQLTFARHLAKHFNECYWALVINSTGNEDLESLGIMSNSQLVQFKSKSLRPNTVLNY